MKEAVCFAQSAIKRQKFTLYGEIDFSDLVYLKAKRAPVSSYGAETELDLEAYSKDHI
jgi:hypothetical protein